MANPHSTTVNNFYLYYPIVFIDDCNFHECVNTNEFEQSKILRISPPDGEFTLMNYRVTGEFQIPFRVFPYVDES